MSSEVTTVALRGEKGKFLEGVSGNPAGRPLSSKNKLVTVKQKLEIAVREHMTAARIGRIIDKMARMAEDGDTKAARLILDKFISSATTSDEQADDKSGSGITIRIENATFAKTAAPVVDVPIEAEFKEVKTDG